MSKAAWLFSTAILGIASPLWAQTADQPGSAVATSASVGQDEIIVTATRRSEALSDVPLAVSAISAETLARSGVSDIRQLNQLSPSLLVSSSQSEANGAAARIRGIGTVGDNPGLESSVGMFVDGVYRSRTGSGLSELGAIDRIEVLRGPQGTLFGRNTSAGLIHVITARPSFEESGTAELSYGNYEYWRAAIGLTGPLSATSAYRLDGVYVKRDGFLTDVVSGRRVNDRSRWLIRPQYLFEPSDALSVRLIGDYAKRDEECCGATYLPARDVTLGPDGMPVSGPSSIAGLIRSLSRRADAVNDDTYARRITITPGRSYRSDVRDWGVSGEINLKLDSATLTSITAYRKWRYIRGQDADFTPLDLLARPDDGSYRQSFATFTQELRLQGETFGGRLDWLVGAYYADEQLDLSENLRFGADYGKFYTCLVAGGLGFGSPNPLDPACLNANARTALTRSGPGGGALIDAFNRLAAIDGSTFGVDRFSQSSRNWALFTHNVFDVTDRLSVTLGARYTNERKALDADLNGSASATAACSALIGRAALLAGSPLARAANTLAGFACVPLAPITSADLTDEKREDQITGTAIVSYKPSDQLLAYASYSKGYKAGGYNLDRSQLGPAVRAGRAPEAAMLRFAPEKVDAFEVGFKYDGRAVDLNVAGFYQRFDNFQLNAFTGTTFEVVNIGGCSALEGGSAADSDNSGLTGACAGKQQAGVVSKGVEIELFARPLAHVSTNLGFTYADTRFSDELTNANGRPLTEGLFQLPGQRISNSPRYTLTGSAGWTPPLGSSGLSGLLYADFRYQSRMNTGSDLDVEKVQPGFVVVNARAGVRGPEGAWAIEFWAQNLFDQDYLQVAFDAPLQPGGTFNTIGGAQRGYQTGAVNQLFTSFLAEPRTFGVTVRTRF
jgi:iron complex outermembrane receptor protein